MATYSLMGLLEIELPTHTIRVCEGGFIVWGANTFRSSDPVFGAIGSVGELSEGVGEEVPVFEITFLPPGTTAPAQLSQPGFQTSPARFWLAQYDVDTGLLVGTPELQFEGELDQTAIEFAADSRTVEMTVVSAAARLLERNIGNSLNSSWHKSVWPGETGHDQATGLGRSVAWGVASQGGGSTGGGGGGFGLDPTKLRAY